MSWLSWIASNVLLASFLACVAWFVQRRMKSQSLALVKLVTPPWVNVSLFALPAASACFIGVCGCEQHARPLLQIGLWSLLGVWGIGAMATGATAIHRWFRFRSLLAHAAPAPAEWQTLAARLASELSLHRVPEILTCPGRLPPLVIPGWRRARVLLPADLIPALIESQKSALLLHELTHVRRGDHWVRLLETAIGVAYWWLPFIGSIRKQLRACEETHCDASVVARLPEARRDYARLLLDVVDFSDPLPREVATHATAMSGAVSDLELRLQSILNAEQPSRRAWPAALVGIGLACAILPCGLNCEIARAQTPTPLNALSILSCPSPEAGCETSSAQLVQVSNFLCPSE